MVKKYLEHTLFCLSIILIICGIIGINQTNTEQKSIHGVYYSVDNSINCYRVMLGILSLVYLGVNSNINDIKKEIHRIEEK